MESPSMWDQILKDKIQDIQHIAVYTSLLPTQVATKLNDVMLIVKLDIIDIKQFICDFETCNKNNWCITYM